MRRSSLVLGALASLAAPVVGVMAYESWAPASSHAVDAQVSPSSAADHGAEPVVRYRPCRAGDHLRHGICVTHKVEVVAAPVVGVAAAGAPAADPAPQPTAPSSAPSPTHPVHALPGHHVHAGGDPGGGPTSGPGTGPTSDPTGPPTGAPTCVPVEDDDPDDDAAEPSPAASAAPDSADDPGDGCDDDADEGHDEDDDDGDAGSGD